MAKADKGVKRTERVEGDGTSLNTSVESDARDQVAEALTKATADSYTLYAKTLGVHWNVQGPSFYGLHNMTEAQYQELHEAARKIGHRQHNVSIRRPDPRIHHIEKERCAGKRRQAERPGVREAVRLREPQALNDRADHA